MIALPETKEYTVQLKKQEAYTTLRHHKIEFIS